MLHEWFTKTLASYILTSYIYVHSYVCIIDLFFWDSYIQIFEGCKFQGFHSQLAICEIFILKILLAKLCLALVREQDTCNWLCLTFERDDGML